jgi:hypothetical protein
MPARMLLLTALCAASLATAQPDGGPRKATADAGTTAKKGRPSRTGPASPPAERSSRAADPDHAPRGNRE